MANAKSKLVDSKIAGESNDVEKPFDINNIASLQEGILNSLPAKIVVINDEGNILFANRLWKVTQKDAEISPINNSSFKLGICNSDNCKFLWDEEDVYAEISRVLNKEKGSFVVDYACKYENDEQRWFTMYVNSLTSTDRCVVISHIEITEQKLAERALIKEKEEQENLVMQLEEVHGQLLQSEKMASIGQLAAGVAHEINNPVGYVNSNMMSLNSYINDVFKMIDIYTEAESHMPEAVLDKIIKVKEKLELDFIKNDITDLVTESLEGLNRVKNIVQDLKDFSHVDEKDWQLSNVHDGIDSTLNIVHNELKYKAEIVKDYGELPEIECIASQLNQVFMNIMVNAAHAIEKKGKITIITGTNSTHSVFIKIEDNGSGISEDNLKKIFNPFFTTKPVGKGTGLGLALSFRIIQRHNGNISVKSQLGKGTAFTIVLPIRQPDSKSETTDPVMEA